MLRKLFQSKKSIEERKIFEKDEIAKMLRVNPEQLKKFEEAYQCEVLDNPEPSDDLFSMNAKDSKKEKDTDVLRNIPEDLVDRIVVLPIISIKRAVYRPEYSRESRGGLLPWKKFWKFQKNTDLS